MKYQKTIFLIMLLAGVGLVSVSGYTYFQQFNSIKCEACGMVVTSEIQEHIKIKDGSGNSHYACCQGCMLRLLDPKKGSKELLIETYCDYYGPSYKITIDAKEYGNITVVTPSSAVILMGTKIVQSCANNRIACNKTAADNLITTGFSTFTMSWQKNPLPQGTPIVAVPMAAVSMAQKGIGYMPPTPTVLIILAVAGVAVLVVSGLMLRKFSSS